MSEEDPSTRKPTYLLSVAAPEDIPDILVLQSENLISKGGALSVEFPAAWFQETIKEMPTVVGKRDGRLVGYLVSSSQAATRHLAIPQAKRRAYPGSSDAYSSGPLCIAASERGRGLVAKLFESQRALLPRREGVGFIRRDNAASRKAHARHGFREVAQFSHAGVEYVVVSYRAEQDM
jgi:L-amino acid N-acyltransferase YncA